MVSYLVNLPTTLFVNNFQEYIMTMCAYLLFFHGKKLKKKSRRILSSKTRKLLKCQNHFLWGDRNVFHFAAKPFFTNIFCSRMWYFMIFGEQFVIYFLLTVSSWYPSLTLSKRLSAMCPDSITISFSSFEAPIIKLDRSF